LLLSATIDRVRRTAVILVAAAVLGGAVLLFIGTRARPLPDPPRPTGIEGLDPLLVAAMDAAFDASAANPESPGHRAELAMVYQANGQLAAAAEAYRQALDADGGRSHWWFHLARAEAALGRYEDALASMQRAADIESGYAPVHWHQGFWLLELGRLDEAEAAFRHAIEAAPNHPTGDVGRIGLARLYLARGEAAPAVALLEPLVQKFVGEAYLMQLLGTAYRQQGRLQEAARFVARATGVKPIWPDPWVDEVQQHRAGYLAVFEEADRMFDAGDTSAAITHLLSLRESRPDDPVLLTKIGETYMRAGNTSQARARLDEALKIDPDYYYAHFILSLVHERGRQPALAMTHVDRAIAAHPRLAAAHRQKARLLSLRGDWAGSEAALEEALHLGLQDLDAQIDLGIAQYKQGRTAEGQATIEDVLSQSPDHIGARIRLAILLAEQGDFEGATRLIGEARQIAPSHPEVRQAAEEILRMRDGGG
jgi:tetratricopeptide (TPR) repeat protein